MRVFDRYFCSICNRYFLLDTPKDHQNYCDLCGARLCRIRTTKVEKNFKCQICGLYEINFIPQISEEVPTHCETPMVRILNEMPGTKLKGLGFPGKWNREGSYRKKRSEEMDRKMRNNWAPIERVKS